MNGYMSALCYTAVSSSMLVVNKVAIHWFPRPLTLLFLQLAFTTMVVSMASDFKMIPATEISLDTVKKFWMVPVAFLTTIYSNIKILSFTNVETFIVLRASTPVVLSILDVQFLNRKLPSAQSWVSIIGVLVCACAYAYLENSQLTVDSIFWLVTWYCTFCFDQIYIKHVVDTVKMSMWERVWYTNALPAPFLFLGSMALEEPVKVESEQVSSTLAIVFLSCFLGVFMSYTAFWARREMSATAFTILGNVCKLLTIAINNIIWDKHATTNGTFALIWCIGFATFYKQAEYDKWGNDKGKLKYFYFAFTCLGTISFYLLSNINKNNL